VREVRAEKSRRGLFRLCVAREKKENGEEGDFGGVREKRETQGEETERERR
jgi:hypothetical protein